MCDRGVRLRFLTDLYLTIDVIGASHRQPRPEYRKNQHQIHPHGKPVVDTLETADPKGPRIVPKYRLICVILISNPKCTLNNKLSASSETVFGD